MMEGEFTMHNHGNGKGTTSRIQRDFFEMLSAGLSADLNDPGTKRGLTATTRAGFRERDMYAPLVRAISGLKGNVPEEESFFCLSEFPTYRAGRIEQEPSAGRCDLVVLYRKTLFFVEIKLQSVPSKFKEDLECERHYKKWVDAVRQLAMINKEGAAQLREDVEARHAVFFPLVIVPVHSVSEGRPFKYEEYMRLIDNGAQLESVPVPQFVNVFEVDIEKQRKTKGKANDRAFNYSAFVLYGGVIPNDKDLGVLSTHQ